MNVWFSIFAQVEGESTATRPGPTVIRIPFFKGISGWIRFHACGKVICRSSGQNEPDPVRV